jgi:hypothetical protein
MSKLRQTIDYLLATLEAIQPHADKQASAPAPSRFFRTFNGSIVYCSRVDDDGDGVMVVLKGGHGLSGARGEEPGEQYFVDTDGYYKESEPSVRTVMSLCDELDLALPDGTPTSTQLQKHTRPGMDIPTALQQLIGPERIRQGRKRNRMTKGEFSMSKLQQTINHLKATLEAIQPHADKEAIPPVEGRFFRTFNGSIVYCFRVDDDGDGVVVVLQGGHGLSDAMGEEPGERYFVDAEGYYKEPEPSVRTVMSLCEELDLTLPE